MLKPAAFLTRLYRLCVLGLTLVGLVALGACNQTMQASAPAARIQSVATPIVMTAVGGISPAQAQRFAAIFNAEAKTRGFQVADFADAPGATRLTMMLDATPTSDGRNALYWVMQVSPDGLIRIGRLNGAELAASPSAETALDDTLSRKIAVQALTNLSVLMAGGASRGVEVASATAED